MANMQLIKVENLKPNSYNPNKVDEKIMEQLKKDIERVGVQQSIIVRTGEEEGTYIIIDGEHRWRTAKALGLVDVPCVVQEMEEHEAMVLTISMNRLRGEFDDLKLAEVLDKLKHHYSAEEINELLGYNAMELADFSSLMDFDFETMEDSEEEGIKAAIEGISQELPEGPALANEFTIPVSFYQLDVIDSCLDMECNENEGKADALTRLCEQVLQAKHADKWTEVQDRKADLHDAEVGE